VIIELLLCLSYSVVTSTYCKALSLVYGQFLSRTFSALSQNLRKVLTLLALGSEVLLLVPEQGNTTLICNLSHACSYSRLGLSCVTIWYAVLF